MTDLDTLANKADRLLEQDSPPPVELRLLSIELFDLINSPDFKTLPAEQRARAQKLLQDLRGRIRGGEQSPVPLPDNLPPMPENGETPVGAAPDEKQHNPFARQSMEDGEKNFYSGRYTEAIKFYDQALSIESDWVRAREHRAEAEGYLRSGHIPAVALPAEAATAFSKAQSAARLGRYQDAMGLLMRAQNILQQFGIQRWQEGQEFEQKLQQNIDAENVYNEGLQLFAQGLLDEGIDKVDAAAQITGLPRYAERLQLLLRERTMVESSTEALNSAVVEPKTVAAAKAALDGLLLKYSPNPPLMRLKGLLDLAVPRAVSALKEEIMALKTQAMRAQTMETARSRTQQARRLVEQARALGYTDETLDQLAQDLENLTRDLARYEDQLQQARSTLDANRSWPAAAARISAELRARYANDPQVIDLNQALRPYSNVVNGLKLAGMALVALLLIGLLWVGFNQARAYVRSLQPTATPTITPTFTETPTPLPSATATPTPPPSPTPSLTPTPQTAKMARKVWARNGCYEEFTAIVQIPEKALVHLLPAERRFDSLSRECLLVEYVGENRTTIGWILIADIR